MNNSIVITIGPQCSGKTTLARNWVVSNASSKHIISIDDTRGLYTMIRPENANSFTRKSEMYHIYLYLTHVSKNNNSF